MTTRRGTLLNQLYKISFWCRIKKRIVDRMEEESFPRFGGFCPKTGTQTVNELSIVTRRGTLQDQLSLDQFLV